MPFLMANLNQAGKLPVGVASADEDACSVAWVTFVAGFEQAILESLADDEVVAFKSVICYRTGLSIQVGKDASVAEFGLRSFRRNFLPDAVVHFSEVRGADLTLNEVLDFDCQSLELICSIGKYQIKDHGENVHTHVTITDGIILHDTIYGIQYVGEEVLDDLGVHERHHRCKPLQDSGWLLRPIILREA